MGKFPFSFRRKSLRSVLLEEALRKNFIEILYHRETGSVEFLLDA